MRTAQLNKKRGYDFEHEVMRGLELKFGHHLVYKVPDVKTMGHLMTWTVPSDIIFSDTNKIYTIEVKQTKLKRIPWRNFKDHQIEWALYNEQAYFVVNFNDRDKVNRTFLVDRAALIRMRAAFESSVPIDKFSEWCVELERKTARFHPQKKGPFIEFDGVVWR